MASIFIGDQEPRRGIVGVKVIKERAVAELIMVACGHG